MSQNNVLFKITVQLENNTKDIVFHGCDQPELLCQEFAKNNNLSETQLKNLIDGVNSCIEDLAKKNSSFNEIENFNQIPLKNTRILKNNTLKGKVTTHHYKNCSKQMNSTLKLLENANNYEEDIKFHLNYKIKEKAVIKNLLKDHKTYYENFEKTKDLNNKKAEQMKSLFGYFNYKIKRVVENVIEDNILFDSLHYKDFAKSETQKAKSLQDAWEGLKTSFYRNPKLI